MKRPPYLCAHLRTLNPERERRTFLRLYAALVLVLSFAFLVISKAERNYRSLLEQSRKRTQNIPVSYGIQREFTTVSDAGVPIREIDGHPSFTF